MTDFHSVVLEPAASVNEGNSWTLLLSLLKSETLEMRPSSHAFLSLPGDPGASKNVKVTAIAWCDLGLETRMKLSVDPAGGPEPALSSEVL